MSSEINYGRNLCSPPGRKWTDIEFEVWRHRWMNIWCLFVGITGMFVASTSTITDQITLF
jgi:hypothetical protein